MSTTSAAARAMPGARHEVGLIAAAQRLAEKPDAPVAMYVGELGGMCPNTTAEVTVTATAFEILRFRLGRRNTQQMLDMPWIGDPVPYALRLFVFGPAERPLIE